MGTNNIIWVTWERQRRNRSLCKALGIKLFEFDYRTNPFIRYLLSILKTVHVFIKEGPKIIFVQNPSIILALMSVTYGFLMNKTVIVDAHNAGVFPFGGKKWWANIISNYLLRAASITLVTNDNLANHVREKGGNPIVLPDPIPDMPVVEKTKLEGSHNVLFICSWADDEPYREVIKSALYIDDTTYIYITGNAKKEIIDVPNNVILTGYLAESDFIQLLYSCDVVMDLTTRNDCLVCGAYEAIAVGKPLILSDTEALRNYFYKGVLYTNNLHQDIAEKINAANHNIDNLTAAITQLKTEKELEWAKMKDVLNEIICSIKS